MRRRAWFGRVAVIACAAAAAVGCRGGTLTSHAGPDGGGPGHLGVDGSSIDGGAPNRNDAGAAVTGATAEAVVTSPACNVWSRHLTSDSDGGAADGGSGTGWSHHFSNGGAQSVGVDGQGRVVLLSQNFGSVDFGDGPVMTEPGPWCAFLSSFAPDGTHRWSRGLAAYNARVSSWIDGGIAVMMDTAVASFDANGNVRWALGFDDQLLSITAQDDGSLIVVTEWTQVVPEGAAVQTVTRLSARGDLVSQFSFNDDDRGSFVSASPAGPLVLVHNAVGGRYVVVANVQTDGNVIWSQTITSLGDVNCQAATPTPTGGVVLAGRASGDVDFGGGPVASSTDAASFLVSLDSRGRYLASATFGNIGSGNLLALGPTGGRVLAGNFGGQLTIDGVHTGAPGDDDFFTFELTDGLELGNVRHYGNGGGDQRIMGLAIAPDGAVLVAGRFEGKLDVGWGLMRATLADAFVAKITNNTPRPGPTTSDGEPSLPANLGAPPPPIVACDPAAGATMCDLPSNGCPVPASADAGTYSPPASWIYYYENPRCVAGRCVWDQRYFQCSGAWACTQGACESQTLALTRPQQPTAPANGQY